MGVSSGDINGCVWGVCLVGVSGGCYLLHTVEQRIREDNRPYPSLPLQLRHGCGGRRTLVENETSRVMLQTLFQGGGDGHFSSLNTMMDQVVGRHQIHKILKEIEQCTLETMSIPTQEGCGWATTTDLLKFCSL